MIDDIISPSYLVGGCVRDVLLGRKPKDWDYATPLQPDAVEAAVRMAGKRPHVTGKRFGTIGFKHDGKFVEVTTFRREFYGTTRKPDVEFVDDINQDLARRDFTINAMAQRGTKLIDPFGGREDLASHLIRAVGNPTERFNEDPLRMLRAIRFQAQLGFLIETKTLTSIKKNAHKVLGVSRERWIQELDKLLIGEYVGPALYTLWGTDLMKFLLPELRIQADYDQNSDWHEYSLMEHTVKTVVASPNDITLRWAALLHDVAKPFVRTENKRGTSNYVFHDLVGAEIVYGIGKRLKWSNERIAAVTDIIRHHLSDNSPIRPADNSSKRIQEIK